MDEKELDKLSKKVKNELSSKKSFINLQGDEVIFAITSIVLLILTVYFAFFGGVL